MRSFIVGTLILLCAVIVQASEKGRTVSTKGAIYNVTVTSTTSATLWTTSEHDLIEKIYIDNRTGYTMYLATSSASAVNTNTMYPILTSVDATKPLLEIESVAFQHVISSAGVPSSSGLYVIISK